MAISVMQVQTVAIRISYYTAASAIYQILALYDVKCSWWRRLACVLSEGLGVVELEAFS